MKDEENKMQSAAPEQQAQPEQTQPESEPAADAAQPGTENEPKAETTAPETPDKKKRPLWLKLLAVFAAALAVLVLLAVLYINGKLDLIHYDDGTVDSVGTVDAEEDQDLDTTGLTQATNDEMEMPEGSPFADEDVLNILLVSTDERTDAVNDWDAFTHLNELDGTKATTEFSSDARADSLILCSLNIKDDILGLGRVDGKDRQTAQVGAVGSFGGVDALQNFAQQILDLAFHWAHHDDGVQQTGGADDLLGHAAGMFPFIGAGGSADKDRLADLGFKFLKFQRAVVKR